MYREVAELKDCKSIAVMGGTFDPVHYGHLMAAEAVQRELGVEKVVFMPVGNPPHKKGSEVTANEDRYNMTNLATKGNEKFVISKMEIEREGETYTIDTVRELRKQSGQEVAIYIIIGADTLLEICKWKEIEKVLEMCEIVVVTRPSYEEEKVEEEAERLRKEYKGKIRLVEIPPMEISSTEIRERIKGKKAVRYLLPEEVLEYIERYNIYGDEGEERQRKGEMRVDEMEIKTKEMLSKKRYDHTKGVIEQAVKLALRYGCDVKKAYIGALLHDYAKEMNDAELKAQCRMYGIKLDKYAKNAMYLLHGYVGSRIAEEEFGVKDREVLNAIKYHTTAREGMTLLEKVVYLADKIEERRESKELDKIREEAMKDIDKAVMMSLSRAINHNQSVGRETHEMTEKALIYLEKERKE